MPAIQLETLSPFGRLAVSLDGHFSGMARVGGQLERLELDSDSGLERAIRLLQQFAEHGQEVTSRIQEFSDSLQDARRRAEAAAQIVGERAKLIQERKALQNHIQEKLRQLEDKVKSANANLLALRKTGQGPLADVEKREIAAGLEQLNAHLADFIGGAQAVKEEAGQARFKSLERDAASLLAALQSSRRKIGMVLPQ